MDNAADDHRMFKVLPNYKTINDPDQPVVALSAGEKFGLVEHYFDPFTFVFTSITAGIEQVTNEKESYGQGAAGLRQALWRRFHRRIHQRVICHRRLPYPAA